MSLIPLSFYYTGFEYSYLLLFAKSILWEGVQIHEDQLQRIKQKDCLQYDHKKDHVRDILVDMGYLTLTKKVQDHETDEEETCIMNLAQPIKKKREKIQGNELKDKNC